MDVTERSALEHAAAYGYVSADEHVGEKAILALIARGLLAEVEAPPLTAPHWVGGSLTPAGRDALDD